MSRFRHACAVLLWMLIVPMMTERLSAAESLPADRLTTDAPTPVIYSRDIKPILSENCYTCHGPDANQRKAKLRLDTHEGATGEYRSDRYAVVPGDLTASTLIQRITTDDEFDRMPPVDSGKDLSAREIDLLQRWVADGAPFDRHWSYQPPVRPEVPTPAAHAERVRNPIDAYVFSRLESEGLAPSPEADRRTLLRRLSFDLTGLPPQPDDVEAFEAATSPEAYTHAVDRLLASPHFGERMAIYWLDLVRYADTTGIHGDNHREVSAYRDYVIDAFNHNKPFDWFTVEQLAGDLLPDPTTEQLVASGYNRLLMTTEEGGAQPKEYRAKYDADRVRNVSSVWLGSTMACAQCHDHKYDPFTMKDFYSLASYFADIKETEVGTQPPNLRLPTDAQREQLRRLDKRIAQAQRRLDTQTPELDEALAAWESKVRESQSIWTALTPHVAASPGGSNLHVQDDDSLFVDGTSAQQERYVIATFTPLTGITGLRLEVMADDRLPAKGPGRAPNGNFVLNELSVYAAAAERPGEQQRLVLQNATADFNQDGFSVERAIDSDLATGWAIMPSSGRSHQAVFETDVDAGFAGGTVLTFVLDQHYGSMHAIGRLRFSVTTEQRPLTATDHIAPPAEIRELVMIAPEARTPEQQASIAAHFRSVTPLLQPARDRLASLQQRHQEINAAVRTMLISESIEEPRTVRVLPRGNWLDESGEEVAPEVPAVLASYEPTDIPKDPPARPTRLDLARWLTDPENPLVARVLVNRLWKIMYGRGLVSTLEDFGSQGDWPTHPELLDWLAVEFIDSGWDVKHMLRLMAHSETYRQTSEVTTAAIERDPLNRLLSRQNTFRLPAECVRDNALAVSGLLNREIGGRSVKPYQPAGYWQHLNYPKRTYEADQGHALYRRGLYTYWCRTFLHPSLLAFDAPTREECTVERTRSNTPLQALVLLNDPAYVEAARALAARVLTEGGATFDERLGHAYHLVLHRIARPSEMETLRTLLEKHMSDYAENPDLAEALLGVGHYSAPANLDPVELAAWTSVTRTILNLHETITRY